ncbi:unnamed protein product, partial [Didymodactylos carnosus]
TRVVYETLLRSATQTDILNFVLNGKDLKQVLPSNDRTQYKFPNVSTIIGSIMHCKPNDITTPPDNFQHFIEQTNEWFKWFERFIDTFHPIIEWLKTYNVDEVKTLLTDIHQTQQQDAQLLFVRTVVERMIKSLKPFTDLHRLCYNFNCLTAFAITQPGELDINLKSPDFILQMKRSCPSNFFVVDEKIHDKLAVRLSGQQLVQWSLACENSSCNIEIICNKIEIYKKDNVQINKHVLSGEFEVQKSGHLEILINNLASNAPRTLWYHVKMSNFSTCFLFRGIFTQFYEKYFERAQQLSEDDINKILKEVFKFIDKLLTGNISLLEMSDLKSIFRTNNIDIRNEVKNLISSSAKDKIDKNQVDHICDWLQTYQYFSFIQPIIECIQMFNIINDTYEDDDNDDHFLQHLQTINSDNQNSPLKDIAHSYKILKQQFQGLDNRHFELIKLVTFECSSVIQMLQKSNWHSQSGRRRFQELRDNLTTLFQLQERNNMILNALIVTHNVCEPFILKAKNLQEFVQRLLNLHNLDESLKQIRIVNDNNQLVNMWLSIDETNTLDNALITMEHLYKTGEVHIYLQRLKTEQSYFEIDYYIDTIQNKEQHLEDYDDEQQQHQHEDKRIKFT